MQRRMTTKADEAKTKTKPQSKTGEDDVADALWGTTVEAATFLWGAAVFGGGVIGAIWGADVGVNWGTRVADRRGYSSSMAPSAKMQLCHQACVIGGGLGGIVAGGVGGVCVAVAAPLAVVWTAGNAVYAEYK